MRILYIIQNVTVTCNHCNRMRIYIYIIVLILFASCEKEYYYYQKQNNNKIESEDTIKKDTVKNDREDIIVSEKGYYYLKIKDIYRMEEYTKCIVEGYIVGETRSTLKQAVYSTPFDDDYTIILSDMKIEDGILSKDANLVIVQLTGGTEKTIRSQLSLKNNPQRQNRRVKLWGRIGYYYQKICINNVCDYEYTEIFW